ncbi:NAD kinase [Paenibacillus alvei]|uniref:NAD kinase n=1 Tax=Paenibacillus alvei TaxID=44250 RepID=A0AAP7A277_PAEAL|nr:NAD kinase [Paenibacillus alvei]MBG9734722.1 inorganic polyphosphate kinase [Paenibacillus alvei]MBG9742967.1 inorganic polyphosphate kinase [Paenibacillus alvei]MCY7483436.1 NAD kinase [Paenibacillus alvei]MCY9582171.1 NAD kinase [Paenibacillus alvei]MCY9587601.1 NAD kinase [Paenibacillus alvei]
MKYAVMNRGDDVSAALADTFHQLANARGLVRDDDEPNIVLSIGGDGTMLQAFHRYINQLDQLAFVGIHTGHLGFYADWKPDEIEMLVQLIAENRSQDQISPRIVKYPLIELQLDADDAEYCKTYIALNEFTLKGVENTLVAQIDINDELFEMFRGDGICVSTPSGSTAYNKSLGGAMVHPSIASLQLAEIASINNRVYRTLGSSLILPKHHHCDIHSRKKQKLLLTVDHINIPLEQLRSIRCRVADQKVTFIRYRPFPFWNRVREAFLGYDEHGCYNV